MNFRLIALFFLALAVVLTSCGRGTAVSTVGAQAENQVTVRGKTTVVSFPKAGLYASLTFTDFPAPVLKTTKLTLQFWDMATGSPHTGPFVDPGFEMSHPNLKLWMVMPDGFAHGSKPLAPKKVTTEVAGVTQVSFDLENTYFSMEGHWEVHLDLVKDGVSQDKAVLIYEVPEP